MKPVDRFLQGWAITLRVLESVWIYVYGFGGIALCAVVLPPPLAPTPGIPISIYDTLTDFRAHWFILGFHVLAFGFLVPYLAGKGEKMSSWFIHIVAFTVLTDTQSVLIAFLHLGGDAHPVWLVLVRIITVCSVVLSTNELVWYSWFYIRFRTTGRRYDHGEVLEFPWDPQKGRHTYPGKTKQQQQQQQQHRNDDDGQLKRRLLSAWSGMEMDESVNVVHRDRIIDVHASAAAATTSPTAKME